MVTLLEMFEKADASFQTKNLYKLKQIYDYADGDSSDKMKFEMKVFFSVLDSMKPKKMNVSITNPVKLRDNFEFNPTISGPNVTLRDFTDRDFSVWYKPQFFFPQVTSVKPTMVDFVFAEGNHNSLYNFPGALQKQLYTYEFFSYDALKEVASKMLQNLNPIKIAMLVRPNFQNSSLADIKAMQYFLKPKTTLIVSEDYLPEQLKMNLPTNISYAENVDINLSKIVDKIKNLL